MAASAFQTCNSKIQPPALKKSAKLFTDEPLRLTRLPYTAMPLHSGPMSSLPSSPGGPIKPSSTTQKRSSSTISLGNLFPRRKSLQTTVLATRRQSLWMNIAKNVPSKNDLQPSLLPLRQEHSSLMRKKILRLFLVFSYLLSISVLAIVLASFYGFFWSGYSTSETTDQSLISSTSNSTFVDPDLEKKDNTS